MFRRVEMKFSSNPAPTENQNLKIESVVCHSPIRVVGRVDCERCRDGDDRLDVRRTKRKVVQFVPLASGGVERIDRAGVLA